MINYIINYITVNFWKGKTIKITLINGKKMLTHQMKILNRIIFRFCLIYFFTSIKI